ncbi:hypothetical protein PG993_003724 [Apiospora rasikravindrae]|uniref:Uncharacterized protein n=1 Tax=Apiospora rasikravindrae TaxID=990691 RepID=A0ABR1U348_9PEZI
MLEIPNLPEIANAAPRGIVGDPRSCTGRRQLQTVARVIHSTRDRRGIKLNPLLVYNESLSGLDDQHRHQACHGQVHPRMCADTVTGAGVDQEVQARLDVGHADGVPNPCDRMPALDLQFVGLDGAADRGQRGEGVQWLAQGGSEMEALGDGLDLFLCEPK